MNEEKKLKEWLACIAYDVAMEAAWQNPGTSNSDSIREFMNLSSRYWAFGVHLSWSRRPKGRDRLDKKLLYIVV